MIKRIDALQLLHEYIQSANLRKHCYAVEAVMLALGRKFQMPNDKLQMWGLAGLIHDLDYEKYPDEHPMVEIEMFEKKGFPKEIIDAIKSHAWGYREGLSEPKTKMEWSLYACDELTGLIVAVALTRPDKKLSSVKLDSIKKKWKEKSFAKGVNREQIGMCGEKLGIKLDDFIEIALKAMQSIHEELGL